MAQKRSTFSVAFYIRRTRLNKHGEAAIVIRVTVDGIRGDTTAKKTINPKLWDSAKGKAYERSLLAKELNMYLDSIRAKFIRIHRDFEQDDTERITAEAVINRFLGKDKPERHTLLEVFREHNEKCHKLSGIDMSPATVERYETSFKHTQEFIQQIYKKDDIYLDEMNRQFIEDYELYLKTVRKCNHNSTTKYLKNFKKITRIAIQKEWLRKDPFIDIKFSLQTVERDFLEKHEIEKIYNKEFTIERLAQVRDVFLVCCFSGLAFSDVKQLTLDHISIDTNGNKWIRKQRQKTKNMCNIPLLEIPLKIIDKYKSHPRCQEKNVLLPVLCNQKMNAYIKEITDLCGINKQVSTHCGRHSFATTVCLSKGVPIETVSQMLGHSCITTTQIYAKITNDKISKDMAALTDKIGDTYQLDTDRDESDYRNIKRIGKKQKAMFIRKKRENNPVDPSKYMIRKWHKVE